jgi:hypothetical protein
MDNSKDPAQIVAKLLSLKTPEEKKAEGELRVLQAKRKDEVLKKEAAKKKEKVKSYFDVRIESTVPAIITYRVLAEDAQQALELIKNKSPNSVQYKLPAAKKLIAKVYTSGGNMMLFMKKLLG